MLENRAESHKSTARFVGQVLQDGFELELGTDINRCFRAAEPLSDWSRCWAAVMAGQFGFMGNQVLEILAALLFSLQLLEFQCYL